MKARFISELSLNVKRWKDVGVRLKRKIRNDRLEIVSAALAYYALFSFVPGLSTLVFIYAWLSHPSQITEHLSMISDFIPYEAQKLIEKELHILSKARAIGVSAFGVFVLALWSASKGTRAIIEALNIIYSKKEERGFIRLNFCALCMTFVASSLAFFAMSIIIFLPLLIGILDFIPLSTFIIQAVGLIILLSLFSFFLSFVYRFGPDRKRVEWKEVTPGAITAGILWLIVNSLFSWYAQSLGNFNKTYGSFSAIIILMLWFYFSSYVVLLGAEINAEREYQHKIKTLENFS